LAYSSFAEWDVTDSLDIESQGDPLCRASPYARWPYGDTAQCPTPGLIVEDGPKASPGLEAGIARCLPSLYSSEKCTIGLVYPGDGAADGTGAETADGRADLSELFDLVELVEAADRGGRGGVFGHQPGIAAVLERSVVDLTGEVQQLVEGPRLDTRSAQ
jgi:hypothetical protein